MSSEYILLDVCGGLVKLEVHFSFRKGFPGKLCGPPEDCYPMEPDEWELQELRMEGSDLTALLRIPSVEADIIDQLEDL